MKVSSKKQLTAVCIVLLLTLFFGLLVCGILALKYGLRQQTCLENVLSSYLTQNPQQTEAVMASLKQASALNQNPSAVQDTGEAALLLRTYGYTNWYFTFPFFKVTIFLLILTLLFLGIVMLFICVLSNKVLKERIQEMEFLLGTHSQVLRQSKGLPVFEHREDLFSPLEDRISKQLLEVEQTAEQAKVQKAIFSRNLEDIAHQLKTPLSTLALQLERLSSSDQCDLKRKDLIHSMRSNLDRMGTLISLLLTQARMDADAVIFRKEKVDVYALVETAVSCLEEQSLTKQITIQWDPEEISNNEQISPLKDPMSINFQGDFFWSCEALICILQNCLDICNPRSTIHVLWDENPLYTEIQILDEGPGLSTENQFHLFDRYFSGRTGSIESSGIGLSLAKSIIEKQNGVIQVQNNPQKGCCFSLRIYH